LNSLDIRTTTNTSDITNLNNTVSNNENNIINLENSVNLNTSNYNSLNSTFINVQTDLLQNSTDINTLSSLVHNVSESLRGIEYDISNDLTIIDNNVIINGNLSNAEFNQALQDISDIKEDLTIVENNITGITYNINDDNTVIDNNLFVNKNITFTGVLNSISVQTFSHLSGLSQCVQNSLTTLFERPNDISFDGLNRTILNGDFETIGVSYFGDTNTNVLNSSSINSSSINFQTTINNISASTFNYLSNVSSNIQTQFNNILQRITNINFNDNTTTISGNLNINGNLNNITPSEISHLAGLNTNVQDRFNTVGSIRFERVRITGSTSTISGSIVLPLGSSDYAVFSTLYYGLNGTSAGTYNIYGHSSGIGQIIIRNITSTGFEYHLEKASGDNVNIDIHFMILFGITGLNYVKNWD
jgi:hypothetical protein